MLRPLQFSFLTHPLWLAGCAVASGVMTALAFYPFELPDLIWMALVPWLLACRSARRIRTAVFYSVLAGFSFWVFNLYWLSRTTLPGMLLLAGYLSLWFVPPGLFTRAWFHRFGGRKKMTNLLFMLGVAAIWCVSEFARSHLFTGFTWNTIAVSQHANLGLIQIADLGGVYLIGALVLFLNAGIVATVVRLMERSDHRLDWHPELATSVLLVTSALAYGMLSVQHQRNVPSRPFRALSIQPAVPQDLKWIPDWPAIRDMYADLSQLSLAAVMEVPDADLLIWPETATPYDLFYPDVHAGLEIVHSITEQGIPVLAGTIYQRPKELGSDHYRNSSILLDAAEPVRSETSEASTSFPVRVLSHYDKQHLVMFGEYTPFRKQLPWLAKLNPVPFDCVPGNKAGRMDVSGLTMSPLICFEDSIPGLARRAVRAGARLLVNQTNDGWFDPRDGESWLAPYRGSPQHRAHLVFRCVENRVPAIRCANSGVSGCISAWGQVGARSGETTIQADDCFDLTRITEPPFGPGFVFSSVQVPTDWKPTVYNRLGDWFAWLCVVLSVGMIVRLCR